MAHFPVFIDLSRKKVIIFGGGKVALRKIETLLKYDADLEVISRSVLPEIKELLAAGKIHEMELTEIDEHTQDVDSSGFTEKMQEADDCNEQQVDHRMDYWLAQADLVIAATGSRSVNHSITSWCHSHGVLVNVIDAPEECTFLFPSIVKRGDISIGINTGGNSPIVSKKIRKDIEESVPEYYADIASQLGEVREYVKDHFDQEVVRRKILKTVAANAFAREGTLDMEELQQIYKECAGEMQG